MVAAQYGAASEGGGQEKEWEGCLVNDILRAFDIKTN